MTKPALPDKENIMRELLRLAADGEEHSLQGAYKRVMQAFDLTIVEVRPPEESGAGPVLQAYIELMEVGLLESTGSEVDFRITERGLAVLQDPNIKARILKEERESDDPHAGVPPEDLAPDIEEQRENFREDITRHCRSELDCLKAKGCDEDRLLDLLWQVNHHNYRAAYEALVFDSHGSLHQSFDATLKNVRKLVDEITQIALNVRGVNVSVIGPLTGEEHSLRDFFGLPDRLEKYAEVCSRLVAKGKDRSALLDSNADTIRRWLDCRVIEYVRKSTEGNRDDAEWFYCEIAALVAAAKWKPLSQDPDKRLTQVQNFETFRKRNYEGFAGVDLLSLITEDAPAKSGGPGRQYPPELRCKLVELVASGCSADALAREYEPSAQTIRNWVKADRDQEESQEG